MKLLRLAMCVAVFAIVGKVAISEDVDVRSLQAKLADQEARLNDLQAKVNYKEANANVAGAPANVLSLRKNAVVSIGGTVNTRYFYHNVRYKDGEGNTIAKVNEGNLDISDAKLEVKVDVNEHFDAYLKVDLISSASNHITATGAAAFTNQHSDNAQYYWVRWKNICNSGFGVLVGRQDLVFGHGQAYGILNNWVKGPGDGYYLSRNSASPAGTFGTPAHNQWDIGRVTQVTPYWEGLDGKLKIEVMFAQKADNNGAFGSYPNTNRPLNVYRDANSGILSYKSRNYGLGTMSARIGYTPIAGLDLHASIVNFYDKAPARATTYPYAGSELTSKNNTALALGFKYKPCFMPKLNIHGQWIHGWNVNYVDDLSSDVANLTVAYDFTESFNFFVQGDYLRSKYGNNSSRKDTGWASYVGARYKIGYGVALEGGWRHESVKYRNALGNVNTRVKADTLYAHLGFDF